MADNEQIIPESYLNGQSKENQQQDDSKSSATNFQQQQNHNDEAHSIRFEHLRVIEQNRVLFLSHRYIKARPKQQKYYHLLYLICCPNYKVISFTTICALAYIVQFIVEISIGINTDGNLLQISKQTLVKLGGNQPLYVRQGEVWRLIVSSILHFDFLHFVGCLFGVMILFSSIEYTMGHFKSAAFYFLVTIGANIFSDLCNPTGLSSGGSPFLFGVVGFLVGYIIINWVELDMIGLHLKNILVIGIFFVLGAIAAFSTPLSNIDYFGPVGGFLAGIWATSIHDPIYFGSRQKYLRRIFFSILIIQYLITFTLFYTLDLTFA